MMKEIHEQPKAVQDTLNSVIKDGRIDFEAVGITEDEIKGFEQIYIVACGSAWHVGMAAQYVLEDMADISVRVELASEFRYRKMSLNPKALMIVVSQSGETADTLAALRLAKEKGITTMAIVNVVGSSIAREADKVFTHWQARRFRWQPRRPIVRSLQQCTAWQCSFPKFVVRSQKSSVVIILPNY